MLRTLLFIVIATLLYVPMVSAEMDMRLQLIDGSEFICYTPADSQVLLQYRMDVPELRKEIINYEKLVIVKDLTIVKYQEGAEALNLQKGALNEQVAELTLELIQRDSWLRSPYLWFSIGLLAGIGTTIGIVYGVK